jgi:DNA-binding NarL/FixJ family response regulator
VRSPQVIVYEQDGALAKRLAPCREEYRWVVREPRRLEGCMELLRQPGPSVFVLRLSRDLVNELTLLEWVAADRPEVPVVAVGDSDDPALAGLLWDLGARFVLVPPWSHDWLVPVVAGLMRSAGGPDVGTAAAPGGGDEP